MEVLSFRKEDKMEKKNLLLIGGAIALILWLTKQKKETATVTSSSIGQSDLLTGMGVSGIPRRGRPKTEAERLATHKLLYGNTNLPPRGTGLFKRGML